MNDPCQQRFIKQWWWYHNFPIQYALIRNLVKREMAFIAPEWQPKVHTYDNIRMQKAHSVQFLQGVLDYAIFNHKPNKLKNLYYSLAKFKDKGIPLRSELVDDNSKSDWKVNYWQSIDQYDFVIDIDAPNHPDIPEKVLIQSAFRSMQNISLYLTGLNCPHFVRFSGRGFHIFIPYKKIAEGMNTVIFDPDSEINIYKEYRHIASFISSKFSDYVDLNIYDGRRIIKLPYSIAHYKRFSRVCYPLTINIINSEDFNPDDYEISRFCTAHPSFPIEIQEDAIICKDGDCCKLLKEVDEHDN
jgi:hypothetical protein